MLMLPYSYCYARYVTPRRCRLRAARDAAAPHTVLLGATCRRYMMMLRDAADAMLMRAARLMRATYACVICATLRQRKQRCATAATCDMFILLPLRHAKDDADDTPECRAAACDDAYADMFSRDAMP